MVLSGNLPVPVPTSRCIGRSPVVVVAAVAVVLAAVEVVLLLLRLRLRPLLEGVCMLCTFVGPLRAVRVMRPACCACSCSCSCSLVAPPAPPLCCSWRERKISTAASPPFLFQPPATANVVGPRATAFVDSLPTLKCKWQHGCNAMHVLGSMKAG